LHFQPIFASLELGNFEDVLVTATIVSGDDRRLTLVLAREVAGLGLVWQSITLARSRIGLALLRRKVIAAIARG
jgi:hypothetical protein